MQACALSPHTTTFNLTPPHTPKPAHNLWHDDDDPRRKISIAFAQLQFQCLSSVFPYNAFLWRRSSSSSQPPTRLGSRDLSGRRRGGGLKGRGATQVSSSIRRRRSETTGMRLSSSSPQITFGSSVPSSQLLFLPRPRQREIKLKHANTTLPYRPFLCPV